MLTTTAADWIDEHDLNLERIAEDLAALPVRDRVRLIALVARGLTGGRFPDFSFGVSSEAVEMIVGLGGRRTTSVYAGDPDYAIDGARVVVDGVELAAQASSRPATAEERAVLVGVKAHTSRSTQVAR